jgi:hypothetical protein
MMNRLITFGDSFTWGSELLDCIDDTDNPDIEVLKSRKIGPYSEIDLYGKKTTIRYSGYSYNTWPALLAKNLNLEYLCHSKPGASNQTIIRTLMKLINSITVDDLVVIDWTFMDRWDYIDHKVEFVEDQWKTLRPGSSNHTDIEKFYYTCIQSELWNKWESLKAISLAHYALKARDIKFLMTCEDSLIFDQRFFNPTYVINAQNEVYGNILWFNNKGFSDWAKDNEYKCGSKNGHPLEEAHRAAFKYILNNYEFT